MNLPLSAEQTKILYDAREHYGQDFCEAFCPVLKNFIQRGLDQILSEKDFFGVPLFELLFKVHSYFAQMAQNGESSANLAAVNGLFIALLENGMGKLDALLPRIVALSLEGLLASKKKKKQAAFLEVLQVCFYYNASQTMRLVVESGASDTVFQKWFKGIKAIKEDRQKTHCLFGMASILALEQNGIPQGIL